MTCQKCQSVIKVSDYKKEFLEKLDLPLPELCSQCRMQRRFAFRNERKLYHRKCDLTGKQIISIYRSDSDYKVYDQHEWHSDKWNALKYGRDFDFSRPFFEQFDGLMKDVPKLSVFTSQNENSDFTNGSQQNKNCYMIFVSDHDQDCYFSYGIDSCKDSTDCLNCFKCELCLECIDCSGSYNLAFCEQTHNSSDSYFLSDCKNCKRCFGCFGLRGKEFHIFNEKFAQEEYEKKIKDYLTNTYSGMKSIRNWFYSNSKEKQINQYYDGNKNQNVTGDHIVNCKNCESCFDSAELEDCGDLIFSFKSKDCFDGHVVVDKCELCYETISTINQYNTQFTFTSFYSKNSMYLDHCGGCNDCFACSGLKKERYCIFNKKYSKEKYESLKKEIIEYMKKTGEYGKFFPISLSPFAYNETVAQEYFPLTKEEVIKNGYKWQDEDPEAVGYTGPDNTIPEDINDVKDDILDKVLICERSKNPYKIMKQELELYRKHNLPLPHICFDERHLERISRRNPRLLWDRKCMKCNKDLESTFSPDKSDIIYCEECYLGEVH